METYTTEIDEQKIIKESAKKDAATTLNLVNYQIAELIRIKEELEKRLCALFEHGGEGQKTYIADKYDVTIRTGLIYSLNKSAYSLLKDEIREGFDPVKESIKYDVDKKIVRKIYEEGSQQDLVNLSQFVTTKDAKLHVIIKAAK